MSAETNPNLGTNLDELPATHCESSTSVQPRAHGSSVINHFNDCSGEYGLDDRDTLYDTAIDYWRDVCGDPSNEPHEIPLDPDDVGDWLPDAREDRDWVLLLTSSRWKAGTGINDAYSPYYDQHLKLREIDNDGDYYKPPLALHIEIMPQYADLVYHDGAALQLPHGEGTRVVCWTTWAESGEAVESRMYDVLRAVYGDDAIDLDERNEDSRKIAKLEAHHRFDIDKKNSVVEALDNSRQLIAYGGQSEIDAHVERMRQGYLAAVVSSDRWGLLGFEPTRYAREVKVYQRSEWHKQPETSPYRHPKIEASFDGVDGGELPHVNDWDDVMQRLRELVSAHLRWANVDDADLVRDDIYAGVDEPSYEYQFPTERRQQLREHYREQATEVYREALKANTQSVYDILKVVATESGATYDKLESRTGLARSTIRYHCRRLEENGVIKRIGNPTLVVFPSLEMLEESSDVLDEVEPDDTPEDMADRADDRRERREERDERDDPASAAADEPDDDSPTDETKPDSDRESGEKQAHIWRPFDEIPLTPDNLSAALEREHLPSDHVRVRTDPYDWLPDS
jgi:ribosomal protein S25